MSEFIFDEPEIVHRSDLERYGTCPLQGHLMETQRPEISNRLIEVGNEIHRVYSEVITDYVESEGQMSPREIREKIEYKLGFTKPWIQSECLAAGQRVAWLLGKLLGELHHINILRYDGGRGEMSGQLAQVMPPYDCTVTSELDLLVKDDDTPDVLTEYDYKTGWKHWTEATVLDSFQFQMHAWLVFLNYETVNSLRVQVVLTRDGSLTPPAYFRRSKMKDYEARIITALHKRGEARIAARLNRPVEAWPCSDTCRLCDVIGQCHARKPIAEASPTELLRSFIVADLHADRLRNELVRFAKESRKPIEFETTSGSLVLFGDRPKGRASYGVWQEGANDDLTGS